MSITLATRLRAGLRRLIMLSKTWSVDEALWLLRVYKCTTDEICYRGHWTIPSRIWLSEEMDTPATAVRVKFLGGPGGTAMYQGSLSMFVVDRVLWHWRENGVGWEWLLRFDPGTVKTLRDQIGDTAPDFVSQKLLPGFEDELTGHWEPVRVRARVSDNLWDLIPSYEDGEQVVDYIDTGEEIYPILESGRQGRVVRK